MSSDFSINYVIGCWSGPRRAGCDEYNQDRSWCIRRHIDALHRVPHNLSQITVVVNNNPEEPKEFTEYIDILPKTIQNAEVVVLRRPNIGISYGCFAHSYKLYRNKFKYMMVTEDDYLWNYPNFDSILIEQLEKKSADYICSYFINNHAALAFGIIKQEALEKVFIMNSEEIPHGQQLTDYGDGAQCAWSYGFSDLGLKITDYLDEYSCCFYNYYKDFVYFRDNTKPLLVQPVQLNTK